MKKGASEKVICLKASTALLYALKCIAMQPPPARALRPTLKFDYFFPLVLFGVLMIPLKSFLQAAEPSIS